MSIIDFNVCHHLAIDLSAFDDTINNTTLFKIKTNEIFVKKD